MMGFCVRLFHMAQPQTHTQQMKARELLKAFNLPGGPTGYGILHTAIRRKLLHPKDGLYDPAEMRAMLEKYGIRVGRKRVA
jgi:hypothetical protein